MKPLSVGAHGTVDRRDGSSSHMAHNARTIAAAKNHPMSMPGSGKVTFCKLTDLERRGLVSDDGECPFEGGQALLDHRMWVAVIPLIHRGRG